MFDLDSAAVQGQVTARRDADAAASIPVPYSAAGQMSDPAPVAKAEVEVRPAAFAGSSSLESSVSRPRPATYIVAEPAASTSPPIASTAVSLVRVSDPKPIVPIPVASPPALHTVVVAPVASMKSASVTATTTLKAPVLAAQINTERKIELAVAPSGSAQATPEIAKALPVDRATISRLPAEAADSGPQGLRSILAAWSAKEKWTVVWAPGVEDIQLTAGQRLEGSLALAVQTVSKLIPPDSKLQITMYEGDKVIHVHAR